MTGNRNYVNFLNFLGIQLKIGKWQSYIFPGVWDEYKAGVTSAD